MGILPLVSFPDIENLIQSAEAAEIIGTSQATFNRRVAAGTIVPAITLPGLKGARLFDRSYIERIAAELSAA